MQWQEVKIEILLHVFFPLSLRRAKTRVGKSVLEGVLKEIRVGINPDIIMSAQQPSPLFPPRLSTCAVLCQTERGRDKSRKMSG